ncbi:MAG: serine/threonine-protein kinase [Planctomycetota bacterium]
MSSTHNDMISRTNSASRWPFSCGTQENARFCPNEGIVSGSGGSISHEVEGVLRVRLRAVSVILFFAFAAFLARHAYYGKVFGQWHLAVFALQGLVTVVMLLSSVFLCQRWGLTLKQLRLAELVVFGLPAVFLAYLQFNRGCEVLTGGKATCELILVESCIPWISLIYIYGLFVPNNTKRAAGVIAGLAAFPFATMFLTSYHQPHMWTSLVEEGYLSLLGLWIGIPAAAAIYGSHTINALRREASAAKQVGSYRLIEKIGTGGMGEVYLAEHKLLKRPCAIKLIHPSHAEDPQSIARFESEVQASAQLTHWNTIEIYDYGMTDDGTFYYAMEYLPGLNLQELIDKHGPMPASRAVHLLRQVCAGLREAHAMGLIHRDIKPGNIFATERGGVHDVAKLVDFGLVKSTKKAEQSINLTLEGMVIGSPLYVAPEHAMGTGPADPRGDIYSLGAVGYFLLTARPLFVHDKPLQVIFAHVNELVQPPSSLNPTVPSDLEAIILRCLEKDPANRFQTVRDLEEALANCQCADEWNSELAESWWQSRNGVVVPSREDRMAQEVTTLMEVGV